MQVSEPEVLLSATPFSVGDTIFSPIFTRQSLLEAVPLAANSFDDDIRRKILIVGDPTVESQKSAKYSAIDAFVVALHAEFRSLGVPTAVAYDITCDVVEQRFKSMQEGHPLHAGLHVLAVVSPIYSDDGKRVARYTAVLHMDGRVESLTRRAAHVVDVDAVLLHVLAKADSELEKRARR